MFSETPDLQILFISNQSCMCEGTTEVDSGGSVCLRLLNWGLNETRLKKTFSELVPQKDKHGVGLHLIYKLEKRYASLYYF